ncbi:hypothetical protein SUDANB145_07162 (plasmid) [Streptomyces sp. enrichment culture]|uniref:hypothetical protein n=1 Tax=Streptomyces sp. enrichment culture TaxID=1795815 RepID=UPI003F550208
MSNYARAVCAFYAALALWLTFCTVQTWGTAATWASLTMLSASGVPIVGILREHTHADDLRQLRAELERHARPDTPLHDLTDGIVAMELAAACCETWWTSAGTEHDGPCTARWARTVAACPECAVTPGIPCHDNGRPRADVHARRIQEAKETTR